MNSVNLFFINYYWNLETYFFFFLEAVNMCIKKREKENTRNGHEMSFKSFISGGMSRKMVFLFLYFFHDSLPLFYDSLASFCPLRFVGRRRGRGAREREWISYPLLHTAPESLLAWFNIVLMNFLSARSDWPVVPSYGARDHDDDVDVDDETFFLSLFSFSLLSPTVVGIRKAHCCTHWEDVHIISIQRFFISRVGTAL